MKLTAISKNYGNLKVLENITLEFPEKKISVILGNSGCGKTTLLNIISGKLKKFTGQIWMALPETHPKFSYIFQNDNLIPWKTLENNIRFVCKRWYSREQLEEIIDKNLRMVKLENYRDYFPSQLSGGMKKRLGIARAFSSPSDTMLMDEPFTGLDINITKSIIEDFLVLQKSDPKTIILVTHDIETAVKLGDYFFLLSDKPTTVKKILSKNEYSSLENLKDDILKNL